MRKIGLIVIHCSATHTDYSPEQLESDHKARDTRTQAQKNSCMSYEKNK
nr:hypothetical protein [Parabacteroides sp.]